MVESIKYVGPNKDEALLKFTLNNDNGRRLKVLLWNDLATVWETKIVTGEIVHIERGRLLRAHPSYFQSGKDLIPFELHLNRFYSDIKLLGKHVNFVNSQISKATPTTIKDCLNTNGKISVQGYIRLVFKEVGTANNYTFGNGVIMNDIYRLTVHINNFQQKSELVHGSHVEIEGEIKSDAKQESIYLQVKSMDDIKLIDKHKLTDEELEKGIITPKKRTNNSDEESKNEGKKKVCINFNDSGVLGKMTLDNERQNAPK